MDMKWTNDLDNELKELIISGKKYDEISFLMKRTYKSVSCRAQKLGLKIIHHRSVKCKNCGKIFNSPISSKRVFCSSNCSAIYNNTNKKHSDETKSKIRNSMNNYYLENGIKKKDDKEKNIVKKKKDIKNETDIKNVIKICVVCKKEFETNIYAKDSCSKECRSVFKKNYLKNRGYMYKYIHDWRKNNKKRAIEYKGGKCIKCGYDKCYAAMDFHHINKNDKDFDISKNCNLSFEKIKEELDKCVILCSNCHREFHDTNVSLSEWLGVRLQIERGRFDSVS